MDTTTSAATVEAVTAAEREQAKRAVEAGRVCCAEGRTVYCVCRSSVKCPRHFPSGVCVGSHD